MKTLKIKQGDSITQVPVKATSEQWSISAREWVQGGISAAISSALGMLLPSIEAGDLVFNWKLVAGAAITGFLTYIARKLPQSSKVLIDKKELQ